MGFKWFENTTPIDMDRALERIEDELDILSLAESELGMPYRIAIVRSFAR